MTMTDAFRAGTPEGRQRFKYVAEVATAFMALAVREFLRIVPDQIATVDENAWNIVRLWEGVLRDWEKSN
jgi:hypothetical protein